MKHVNKKGKRLVVQKGLPLFFMVTLVVMFASCGIYLHPLGSKNLSEDSMEQIVEGVTTKDEVRTLLGVPMQAMLFDEVSLADYLNRTYPERPTGYIFPEDQYEVWTYTRLAKSLVLGRNIEERSIIIMNGSEICIAKFYERNGELIE
jgi:hypothetical protein